jgi:cytochrome c biogenesis protein CcdA/glutaredoxin
MKKIFKYFLLVAVIFLCPFLVSAKESDTITLYLFHGDGCPHCAEEIKFLDSIQDKYDNLEIVKYEVWYNDDNATLLSQMREALDINSTGVPTTIIGSSVIIGYGDSTGSKIERAIKFYEENDYVDYVEQVKNGTFVKSEDVEDDEFTKIEKESDEDTTIDVPTLGKVNLKNVSLMSAAVIIGLVDGFNPCAMWVLLFLISVLIGMKDRRRMWAIGLTFLLTSAFVYLLIMLSWISIAVKITTIVWVRNVIAVIAVIGGVINLKSFFKSNDSGCEVVDDKKRKNIFKKIRKFTSEKSFFLALIGVMGLAISVNLVELACSAGLPLVFSELLALNNTSSFMKFMYTLLYIFFFLIDDLVVFLIAMFTMKVTGISTKYNKFSHLIGGIIMLVVGILLIFKPGLLMFNFS